MTLSASQKTALQRAIQGYRFPAVFFDFSKRRPVCVPTMRAVEKYIRQDLVSGNSRRVKNGLSNVLFWGYAQMGVRDHRVKRFRLSATSHHIRQCATLFRLKRPPTLAQIKALALPGFSGMSFISKVRMFLEPRVYATLDLQLAKLRRVSPATILSRLKMSPKATQIPVTAHNERIYNLWCQTLTQISVTYFRSRYNAAEVERGFFHLVQCGKLKDAASILRNA